MEIPFDRIGIGCPLFLWFIQWVDPGFVECHLV